MSPERIRPGDAARRRGGGGGAAQPKRPGLDLNAPGDLASGDGTPATGTPATGTPATGTPGVGAVEGPGTGQLGEADVPFALPGATHDPGVADQVSPFVQVSGPQGRDEPLRPEEFVSEAAAEQVLGAEEARSRLPGARGARAQARESLDADPVDSELASEDLAGSGTGTARERFWHRLYYGRTSIDFVRRRRTWFTISSIVILAGVISLATRGLDLGIDFVGGSAWTVKTSTVSPAAARSALTPLGFGGATITVLGSSSGTKELDVEAKLGGGPSANSQSSAEVAKVTDTLARLAHVGPEAVGVTTVGPSWGSSVTSKALEALIVFFILVSIYISVFFEWRMALGAVLAVAHDVLVVVGIYSLTGLEVTPDTVVAILTILGYSLYDTIVVFDRVRDNVKGIGGSGKLTISDVINLSMNQTLARSINTSLVAILPIFAVLILGADILGAQTLQYFGWALLIGLLSGAYSSIFIAAPIVAALKEREPRYRNIREKLAARGLDRQLYSAAAIAAGALGGEISGAPSRRRIDAGAGASARSARGAGASNPRERGSAARAKAARASSGPRREDRLDRGLTSGEAARRDAPDPIRLEAPKNANGAPRSAEDLTDVAAGGALLRPSASTDGDASPSGDRGARRPAPSVARARTQSGAGGATPASPVQRRPPARARRKGRSR